MKVLLVSHTVLSKTGNMGKTLRCYLADFAPEDIAQFYIHSEFFPHFTIISHLKIPPYSVIDPIVSIS